MFVGDAYECDVFSVGVIAQLGERMNGIHEVDGSIPSGSTTEDKSAHWALLFFPGCVPFSDAQTRSILAPRAFKRPSMLA